MPVCVPVVEDIPFIPYLNHASVVVRIRYRRHVFVLVCSYSEIPVAYDHAAVFKRSRRAGTGSITELMVYIR